MYRAKKVLIYLIVIILLGVVGYSGFIYFKAKNTLADIYVPIISKKDTVSEKPKETEEEISVEEPISILLLGIDGEGEIGSRSDSLIVMTMNPINGTTTMVSIPRDSRTEIIGKGKVDKINHAHAFGGPQMAIDTVEDFLGIPIDYFVSVDMKGFKEVVNIFGGVTVSNDFDFSYGGHSFKTGKIELNGDEALAYARMRKEDPRGDLGRNDRQKQIIESLMQKAASVTSVSKAKEILDMIGNNVKTNAQLEDMKTLQQYYFQSKKNTQILSLTGTGQKINSIWYFIINEENKQQISNKLKEELNTDSITIIHDEEFVY